MRFNTLLPTLFLLAYDEASDAAAAAEAARLAEEKKQTPKTFTQDELNKIVADEKRKTKLQSDKLVTELEAMKSKVNLNNQDREELEARIEAIKSESMTKEELLKQEKDRNEKKLKTDLEAKTAEANSWKTRFTSQTINRTITDAAIATEAFNPKQIVAQLLPNARLVDVLDESNKPTGEFVAKVKITETDKDGKAITLDLEVGEAVKKMSDQAEFANLFKGKGTGGTGGQNRGGGKATDLKTAAMDPATYRELRKSGKLPL